MKKSERSANADTSSEVVLCEPDETTCLVCFAEFLDPDDLALHIQQVHPSGKLVECQFCDKIVSDAEAYVLHIRDAHLLDFKSCLICYRIFANNAQLRKHELKHPPSTREGPVPCSQCGQFFLTKSELRQHEFVTHFNSGEGVFLDKYFALLSSVINIKANTFIKSIENEDEFTGKQSTYVCTFCKYRNTDLEAYVMHLRKNNCRTLTCEKCCSVFKKKAGLTLHVTKQTDCGSVVEELCKPIKIKPKQCVKCQKYFDSKSMKGHICIQSLKCSHCETVFTTMYELSEHQSRAHPLAVELTMCKFCRKECVGTVMLEKHMQRSHSQELHLYKYTCSYCDTTFKHPQRLFAHYFMKHKDIEPYLCKICDIKFRIRKPFTLHIKLKHKSEGFVEFDERLHVFFTDKKSEKPFQPVSKYGQKPPAADGNKKQNKKNRDLQLANMESDVNFTDTEGNQTDANETKEKSSRPVRKRKKPDVILELSDYDSDDEPLVVTKKKAKLKSQLRKRPLQWKKRNLKKPSKGQFTCDICKKYCYTFQNYQNHLSMHFKDESKRCVKCSLSFKTKVDLERHMRDQHSSSRLTETLKNILERRKKGEQTQEMSATKKFLNTIKKIKIEKDNVTATIKPISKELSVQKFIESFTPEGGEVKNVQITNSASLIKVANPVPKEPVIKLNKFKPTPEIKESLIQLAMPVKFKKCNERHSVTVKKVKSMPVHTRINFMYDDGNQFEDDNDYNNDNYEEETKDTNIPEAEQEVTLEVTEEVPKRNPATHKIVIPKLPKELKSIRIAHLLPEAPYYKIVKMDDIIKQHHQQEPVKKDDGKANAPPAEVRLPDGTKLVHVNPLAHLLGDTPVEQIVKPNKYYKTGTRNFQDLLANALKKLDNLPKKQAKRRSGKTENVIRKEIELPEKDVSETAVDLSDNVPPEDPDKVDYECLIDVDPDVTERNLNNQTLIDTEKDKKN
ncbi:zinc finger protein 585A-like [Cydia strobilella]|uniref:zinc finger protein 585A-like n=1 Tax=Cydia strobilella TaxID=1100964 RepID=UPI003005A3A7